MNYALRQGSMGRVAKALVVATIALSSLPLLAAQVKMTSEQAFDPSFPQYVPSPDPTTTTKKVALDASYEEVFHAASNAVTQSMWELDKQDKTAGVLFAHMYQQDQHMERYFFHVMIKELSAKQTEVALEGRLQETLMPCPKSIWLKGNSGCKAINENSRRYALGIWLPAETNPQLSQFVVLLRNNLIAAGVQ